MALFVGGPADGWRINVPPGQKTVDIAINPHAPAFTPDSAVLSARTGPAYRYKIEEITCGAEPYDVYIPNDWDCNKLVDALMLNYGVAINNTARLDYINSADGVVYDNDDRDPIGRPYRI